MPENVINRVNKSDEKLSSFNNTIGASQQGSMDKESTEVHENTGSSTSTGNYNK